MSEDKYLDKEGFAHFWENMESILEGKVDVKSINLEGKTTTILAEVKKLGVAGIDYARFMTLTDGGSSGISDKPTGSSNGGFCCVAHCQRRYTSSDYEYQLTCFVHGRANPYVAHVASDASSITWLSQPLTTDSSLSSTSTNPVQNKVINSALNGKNKTIYTSYNVAPTEDTTAAWKTALGGNGIYCTWYNTANKFTNQPAQYGFLKTVIADNDIRQDFYVQTIGTHWYRTGNGTGWYGASGKAGDWILGMNARYFYNSTDKIAYKKITIVGQFYKNTIPVGILLYTRQQVFAIEGMVASGHQGKVIEIGTSLNNTTVTTSTRHAQIKVKGVGDSSTTEVYCKISPYSFVDVQTDGYITFDDITEEDYTNASSNAPYIGLTKPNNATLTIQKNGTNVQTFTADASSNKTANITTDILVNAGDKRASLIPTDAPDKAATLYFTSKGGLDSQSNDNKYCDALVLNTWSNTEGSGGRVNALVATKTDAPELYHYSSRINDTTWANKKKLAYTDDLPTKVSDLTSDVGGNVFVGTCETVAATAAKEVTISADQNFELQAGVMIVAKFTYTNSASNPTINVNGTGAKSIWYNTGLITTGSLNKAGYANRFCYFVYDGTNWVWINWGTDDNTTYSTMSVAEGQAGTATSQRVMRADYLKQIIQSYVPTTYDGSLITDGSITFDKTASGEFLKLETSTTDPGEGSALDDNTLLAVYDVPDDYRRGEVLVSTQNVDTLATTSNVAAVWSAGTWTQFGRMASSSNKHILTIENPTSNDWVVEISLDCPSVLPGSVISGSSVITTTPATGIAELDSNNVISKVITWSRIASRGSVYNRKYVTIPANTTKKFCACICTYQNASNPTGTWEGGDEISGTAVGAGFGGPSCTLTATLIDNGE